MEVRIKTGSHNWRAPALFLFILGLLIMVAALVLSSVIHKKNLDELSSVSDTFVSQAIGYAFLIRFIFVDSFDGA